ncbi:threonine/serine ThrE exporter family protein [Uliginosibacterium sp. H1]|uniref:threonine/serine ThrE exporter family protein n=1 Tax=Uliginosibacterium sp. H1 TaxID=3114757 RepID=UPI002E19CD10|nr:threonine/serine exporter family protein [Uliginosibacterium sp. H1]
MTRPDEPRIALLQLAARLLLTYNLRTHQLRDRLQSLAHKLGLSVQVSILYRSINIFVADGPILHAQTAELRINVAIASRVLSILDDIEADHIDVAEGLRRLQEAESTAERHPRWILALIFGLAASALAALLSADMAGMVVTGVSSALGLLLRQEMGKRHMMLLSLPFSAAFVGSVLGGIVILMEWTSTPGICLIVPALMLVPGPHLINGLYDTLENHLQTGMARLFLALGILLAAALGIFLGAWLVLGATVVPPWQGPAQPIPLWMDVVLAGVASCGFGAFYNAPWRVLWTSIACGMVGHGVRYLSLLEGISLPVSTLFACVAIGVMAAVMSRRLRVPFAAVAFAGAVPMMPGVLFFQSFGGAMQIAMAGPGAHLALISHTASALLHALLVVGAMGLGLLLGAAPIGRLQRLKR